MASRTPREVEELQILVEAEARKLWGINNAVAYWADCERKGYFPFRSLSFDPDRDTYTAHVGARRATAPTAGLAVIIAAILNQRRIPLSLLRQKALRTAPGALKKLSPLRVQSLVEMALTGKYSQTQLARHFGVSQRNVSALLRRRGIGRGLEKNPWKDPRGCWPIVS